MDQEKKLHKNITIRFKGPADGTAARRAEKARQLCRASGKWQPLKGHGEVRVYVNQDKSKKQNKTEWASRQLKRILLKELPEKKSMVLVAEGVARIEELDTISVDVGGPSSTPSLLWNQKAVRELQINKQSIINAFNTAVSQSSRSREDIMWSG
eukprot:12417883-Karenia_brevis.AAC.1